MYGFLEVLRPYILHDRYAVVCRLELVSFENKLKRTDQVKGLVDDIGAALPWNSSVVSAASAGRDGEAGQEKDTCGADNRQQQAGHGEGNTTAGGSRLRALLIKRNVGQVRSCRSSPAFLNCFRDMLSGQGGPLAGVTTRLRGVAGTCLPDASLGHGSRKSGHAGLADALCCHQQRALQLLITSEVRSSAVQYLKYTRGSMGCMATNTTIKAAGCSSRSAAIHNPADEQLFITRVLFACLPAALQVCVGPGAHFPRAVGLPPSSGGPWLQHQF